MPSGFPWDDSHDPAEGIAGECGECGGTLEYDNADPRWAECVDCGNREYWDPKEEAYLARCDMDRDEGGAGR